MEKLNYVINSFTSYDLDGHPYKLYKVTIYATGVKTIRKSYTVGRYIDALKLVQQLQEHLSPRDRKIAV